MLDHILRNHGVDALPMRYAATLVSLEGKMFTNLLQVCRSASGQDLQPSVGGGGRNDLEVHDGDLILDYDRDGERWLRVRQEGCPDHLFAVVDPTAPDAVWFCCTNRDWLSFMVMLHQPRG